jgi:S1-C subfamily serine protease
VAAAAAGAGAGTVVALTGSSAPTGVSAKEIPVPQQNAAGSGGSGSLNAQAVANKVEPGVVDVTSTLHYSRQVAEGTGIVINQASGLVLTNNHVIRDATKVTATVVDSGKTYPVKVLGYDANDDVALIQLKGATGLRAVSVGNSAQVTVGTRVLAIGNEDGQGGPPTIAPGTINALNRTITAGDEGSGVSETLHNMLQTNAKIQPGDSGGPLANAAGQVIGIDTAAGSTGQGTSVTGFAIPINSALAIADQIAAGHASSTVQIGLPGFLGVLVAPSGNSSPQGQAQQQLQAGATTGTSKRCVTSGASAQVPASIAPASSGALVEGALCGTSAASNGLAAGDVITSVGGQAVTSPNALTGIMAKHLPATAVSVTWIDTNGKKHTSSLTLGTAPAR